MQKILLIEDDEQLRRNTAEILELSAYEVLTAENGKIGVEKALASKPDLVICDIMMPILDGYGVLKVFSKNPHLSTIPIILLTAKSERSDIRKGMELGADDYLTKPFDELELLSAIETRLHKSTLFVPQTSTPPLETHWQTGLESLLDPKKGHIFKKKAILYTEGDDATRLYYIKQGKVKAVRQNNEGKELITGLYQTGDWLGYTALLQQVDYQETIVVLEESHILHVPKEAFMGMIEQNATVASSLLAMLAKQILNKEQQLLGLAYNSLRKRVADALVLYAQSMPTHDSQQPITVQISREDLASMAGTATESLIRTLSDFRQEGLVDIVQGKVVITQIEKIISLKY